MTTARGGIKYSGVNVPNDIAVDKAGENLRYSYLGALTQWRRPTDRTLQMFSKLGDAPPDEILAFARQNGVLGVARIKPEFTNEGDLRLADDTVWRFYSTGTAFNPAPFLDGREPLALWRMLATQLQAILRINARLKGRTHDPSPKLSPDQWKIIDPDGDGPLDQPEDEQFFFQILINKWLTMGKVRPVLETAGWSRNSTKWMITIAYDGLVGALAYRLLLTVVGEDRLYICSGCGEPYVRAARAPRPGQENFCSDCGDIAARRAVERYRQRKRKGERK